MVASGEKGGGGQKMYQNSYLKQVNSNQNSHFVDKETKQHVWFTDTMRESGRDKRMAKFERNP